MVAKNYEKNRKNPPYPLVFLRIFLKIFKIYKIWLKFIHSLSGPCQGMVASLAIGFQGGPPKTKTLPPIVLYLEIGDSKYLASTWPS